MINTDFLINKKFCCPIEDSEKLQKKLFKLGIFWVGGDSIIQTVNHFFVNEDKELTYSSEEYFKKHEYEEINYKKIMIFGESFKSKVTGGFE